MSSPNQSLVSPSSWWSPWLRSAHLVAACLATTCWCSSQNLTVLTTPERAARAHEAFLDAERENFAVRTAANEKIVPLAPASLEGRQPRALTLPQEPSIRRGRSPWQRQIRATVFWVGEKPTSRNPTSNVASSWDPNWEKNFGGYDHPFKREGFRPARFEPKLNPFYIALPYNDLVKGREHRPEASTIIPWFWREYRGPGVSVCADRWLAIHHKGKVCFAQWKDVGPFAIDDGKYVFEGERPRPNANQNAGIDISPAVRDFLELKTNADVDWRFVEVEEVPSGPWSKWLKPPPPDLPTKSGP